MHKVRRGWLIRKDNGLDDCDIGLIGGICIKLDIEGVKLDIQV